MPTEKEVIQAHLSRYLKASHEGRGVIDVGYYYHFPLGFAVSPF